MQPLLGVVIKERAMIFLTLPPPAEWNVHLRGGTQAAILDQEAEVTQ